SVLHSFPTRRSSDLPERVKHAIARGARWLVGMQSSDGGWGAFDADNCQWLIRDLPFCDFGEVIDPPSADVTAHSVETLTALGRRSEEHTSELQSPYD